MIHAYKNRRKLKFTPKLSTYTDVIPYIAKAGIYLYVCITSKAVFFLKWIPAYAHCCLEWNSVMPLKALKLLDCGQVLVKKDLFFNHSSISKDDVIPAQAGIYLNDGTQVNAVSFLKWIPAFAGMTPFILVGWIKTVTSIAKEVRYSLSILAAPPLITTCFSVAKLSRTVVRLCRNDSACLNRVD